MRTLIYGTHVVTSTSSTSLKSKPLISQPPTSVIIVAVSSVEVGNSWWIRDGLYIHPLNGLERRRKAARSSLGRCNRTLEKPGV